MSLFYFWWMGESVMVVPHGLTILGHITLLVNHITI